MIELHLMLNWLGINCLAQEYKRPINTIDSDGDGFVNFLEFKKMTATIINNGSIRL